TGRARQTLASDVRHKAANRSAIHVLGPEILWRRGSSQCRVLHELQKIAFIGAHRVDRRITVQPEVREKVSKTGRERRHWPAPSVAAAAVVSDSVVPLTCG